MKINTLKTLLATVILSNLVACSGGEPSENEIRDILQEQFEKDIASSGGALKEGDMAINSITNIKCSEALAKGEAEFIFNCDIKLDIRRPFAESVVISPTIQLVKLEDGWILSDFQLAKSKDG